MLTGTQFGQVSRWMETADRQPNLILPRQEYAAKMKKLRRTP